MARQTALDTAHACASPKMMKPTTLASLSRRAVGKTRPGATRAEDRCHAVTVAAGVAVHSRANEAGAFIPSDECGRRQL
jgi:hypothetical protein